MNILNLLDEVLDSEIGIAFSTPSPARAKENIWKFIYNLPEPDRSKYLGSFLITFSPYDPQEVFILKKDMIPEDLLSKRGGTIDKPNWQPRKESIGPGSGSESEGISPGTGVPDINLEPTPE